jgi:hypothetical protein
MGWQHLERFVDYPWLGWFVVGSKAGDIKFNVEDYQHGSAWYEM